MSVRALKSVLVVGVKKQSTYQDEKAFAMFYCSLELYSSPGLSSTFISNHNLNKTDPLKLHASFLAHTWTSVQDNTIE